MSALLKRVLSSRLKDSPTGDPTPNALEPAPPLASPPQPLPRLMETAIRWSPASTPSDLRFLIADVVGKSFKLCRITGCSNGRVQWEELSRNTSVPPFRAFDWSPPNNVVAVGQWSGETTVLTLENGSQALSLPIKSQRQCNAVAFNSGTFLATGLERIRNDHCLNIYDINHWVAGRPSQAAESRQQIVEPLRKLSTSEGITSIKFLPQQPKILVAGVKGACVRIYDLRESSGNPALQYHTTCVHNIAIDPTDEHYFASAGPPGDLTVSVWDSRSTLRPSSPRGARAGSDGAVVKFEDVFGEDDKVDEAVVWSLRFSSTESGSLGVLGNNGHFRIFKTKKDYVDDLSKEDHDLGHSHANVPFGGYCRPISLDRIDTVEHPYYHRQRGSKIADRKEAERIVSFDFTNLLSSGAPCAITLRGNQNIGIYPFKGPPPILAVSPLSTIILNNPNPKTDKAENADFAFQLFRPDRNLSTSDAMQALRDVDKRTRSLSAAAGPSARTGDPNGDGQLEIAEPSPISMILNLDSLSRLRAKDGYLFDAARNLEITSSDPALACLWSWVDLAVDNAKDDKMVCNKLDLSFLGVSDIWNGDLGRSTATRHLSKEPFVGSVSNTIEELVKTLNPKPFDMAKTEKAAHRRLCMHTLGLHADKERVQDAVDCLVEGGCNTEACLLALLFGYNHISFSALRKKADPTYDAIAMLIATVKHEGLMAPAMREQVNEILGGTSDPFVKAILGYYARFDWQDVLEDASHLDVRYLLAIALKCLDDFELTEFLKAMTANATEDGNLEGVLLTGLGDGMVPLLARYIELTNDLQTAVLAATFTSPKFVRHPFILHWRESYRTQLNSWKLWIQRSRFDTQAIRINTAWDAVRTIEPPSRHFVLKCANCEQQLDKQAVMAAMTTARKEESGGGRAKRPGIRCPKCGVSLPTCSVCDREVGLPGPAIDEAELERTKGKGKEKKTVAAAAAATEAESATGDGKGKGKEVEVVAATGNLDAARSKKPATDPWEHHLEMCATCNHMYHQGHANIWFRDHVVCAAKDCNCWCRSLDEVQKHG